MKPCAASPGSYRNLVRSVSVLLGPDNQAPVNLGAHRSKPFRRRFQAGDSRRNSPRPEYEYQPSDKIHRNNMQALSRTAFLNSSANASTCLITAAQSSTVNCSSGCKPSRCFCQPCRNYRNTDKLRIKRGQLTQRTVSSFPVVKIFTQTICAFIEIFASANRRIMPSTLPAFLLFIILHRSSGFVA